MLCVFLLKKQETSLSSLNMKVSVAEVLIPPHKQFEKEQEQASDPSREENQILLKLTAESQSSGGID